MLNEQKYAKQLKEYINEICKSDKDSTYFRYPFSKYNQANQDRDKYSMEEVSDFHDILAKRNANKGSFSMIVSDSEGDVETFYTYNESRFDGLIVTFKQATGILSDYQSMTRMILFNGF